MNGFNINIKANAIELAYAIALSFHCNETIAVVFVHYIAGLARIAMKRDFNSLFPAFQLVFLAAFVAYVQAGGPAAYTIAALSGDHAYVGSQHEHTVKVCQRCLWNTISLLL